jgi:hypothetical protein
MRWFFAEVVAVPTRESQINPGKAGPKGALAEKPKGKPSSGPSGNEGQNTRRDFVTRKKGSTLKRGER